MKTVLVKFHSLTFVSLLVFSSQLFSQKVNFKTQVWPIIESKCLDCHNDQDKHPQKKKPKSGLQLDTPEMIAKGGGNGAVVVPGKPNESSLYTLSALPDDHEDVMPPKGELLTKIQLAIIKKWIEEGADYGVKLKKYTAPVKKESELNVYDIVGKAVPAADASAIKYFEKRKYFIQPVQEGNSLLRLDFLTMKSLDQSDFSNLKKLNRQLVYLNFAKTNIQNRDLVHLSNCSNLITLHLENTEISDSGLAHLKKIKSLEYLNLYGTKVSDKGLSELSGLKNLKKIYLWKTKVTKKGSQLLKKTNPKLSINLGD